MQSNPFLAIQQHFQARAAQLACRSLNHLLGLEPTVQAHLSAHAGRTVLLKWEVMMFAPAGEQAFTIDRALNLTLSSAELSPADVTITLSAGLLQAKHEERLRFIRIEGDALLAKDLSLVAHQLRWDGEHDLAKVVGDTPARWITRHAKLLASLFNQAVMQFKDSASNAVIHYPGWVVGVSELDRHQTDIQELKSRVDALSARLAGVKR